MLPSRNRYTEHTHSSRVSCFPFLPSMNPNKDQDSTILFISGGLFHKWDAAPLMMQLFCHIRLRWYFGIRCLAQGHVAYRGQGLNHWPLYDWRSTWATAALLYRPWNSSYPKGAWFITWFFCLVTWIEAQGWIRIPLQNAPLFLLQRRWQHLGYGG